MKTNLILAIIFGFALFACSNTSNEKLANEETHHQDEFESIILNDGKKWVVVPEMMTFIRIMESGIVEFAAKENPTSEEYQQLAILIDENIRDLTSNCTMKGQAHDELHKWLVPFIELSKQFDVVTVINEQEKIYQEFKKSYKVFNIYFK